MATDFDLPVYKQIEPSVKILIDGYLRITRQSFPAHIPFYNIPMAVNYICTAYYYLTDQWDPAATGNDYSIIQDNALFRSVDHGEQSAMLKNVIYSGQYHWKFQLTKYRQSDWAYILIGVVKHTADRKEIADSFLGRDANTVYVLDITTTELNIHEQSNEWKLVNDTGYAVKGKQSDIIDLQLDLNNLSLSFAINGVSYGKAFDIDEGFGYSAAVSIRERDDEVTLLSSGNLF